MFRYLDDNKKFLGMALTYIFIGFIFGFLIAYFTTEPKPSVREVKFDENFVTPLSSMSNEK